MKLTRFCFHSTLSIATTVITTCIVVAPSEAFELVFSSPNVLSGIKGVPFTLPSTGKSGIYNVTLERGTVFEVYGTPPIFDLVTQEDALAAMNASAAGINFYIANVSDDLSFESLGTDVFYIPYSIDPDNGLVPVVTSRRKPPSPNFIDVSLEELAPDDIVVYTNISPVPEPSSSLGFLSLGILGAASTLKRKRK